MRKALCLALSLCIIACMSGCGKEGKDTPSQPTPQPTVNQQEPSEVVIGAPADSIGFELSSEDVMSTLGELPPVPPKPSTEVEVEQEPTVEDSTAEDSPQESTEQVDGVFTTPTEETKIPNMGIFLEDD